MKSFKPSKTLNERAFIMGLSIEDLTGLGTFFFCLLLATKAISVSPLWSVLGVLSLLAALIPFRLKHRRGLIRDSIQYFLKKRKF